MGLSKEEKSRTIWRGLKTIFFLIAMSISFLYFSAPVLLLLADFLLPYAIFSASLNPSSLSLQSLPSLLKTYDFTHSLVDIPLISILRSTIIICVYSLLCGGPRLSLGPYLGVTTLCSVLSVGFVSLKASFVFSGSAMAGGVFENAMEISLFISSFSLAIGHVFVAYRTSCRERRKLLIYKIDIEAVSAYKSKFGRYPQILPQERVKCLEDLR